MSKSPVLLASELLNDSEGGLEEIRVHLFEDYEDDEEAHDDTAMEKLYSDFSEEYGQAEAALSEKFGEPIRTGKEEDDDIPLNGVMRFAIWEVSGKQFFLAFAHEDHGLPILLMLGTVDE